MKHEWHHIAIILAVSAVFLGLSMNSIGIQVYDERNIEGFASYSGISEPNCRWFNIEESDYYLIGAMRADEACQTLNYDTCQMTALEYEKKYFASTDGSCTNEMFADTGTEINNCDTWIRSSEGPCAKGDQQSSFNTIVYCCNN